MRSRWSYFILTGIFFISLPTFAVLFYSTGDTAYNTTEPTGSLADSGWQFQGNFLQYLGTPVSAHHFLTAQHFGGSVGNTFTFDGTTYTTTAKISDPESDLVLYEVNGTFPRYAPLYTQLNEVGKDCVVFGRGLKRGSAVQANGLLKGWEWGSLDSKIRWGENVIEGIENLPDAENTEALKIDFNSSGNTNECMLADKDSGGGVFIEDGGVWKLAAINYAVNPATFSFDGPNINTFNAALFDYSYKSNSDSERLYYVDFGIWNNPVRSTNSEKPCSFYSTRISTRSSWISSSIPEFDQDVDGLPDWWELQYGPNETWMDPGDDSLDGDGFTNYEEWIADTIPNDPNSFLRVSTYTNAAEIIFDSSTNRKYQIEYRGDLADTNEMWEIEVAWFQPVSTQTVQSVSTSTTKRIYRIRAKLR